eukprot:COSAG01_NODE_1182_length_11347_cov_7.504356_6_plen_265_part_00
MRGPDTIAGNHDYYSQTTVGAEIEYGRVRVPGSTGRWRFPVTSDDEPWYDFVESFRDRQGQTVTVHFFMLDTVKWGASPPLPLLLQGWPREMGCASSIKLGRHLKMNLGGHPVGLCQPDAKKFNRPRVDTKLVRRSWLVAKVGGAGRYRRAMTACQGDPCCVYSNWTKYLDARCEVLQPWDPSRDGWQLRISCDLENRLSRYGAAQRRWLEDRLNRSHAHWKVVVGHHPVWSVADHGGCCMHAHLYIILLISSRGCCPRPAPCL